MTPIQTKELSVSIILAVMLAGVGAGAFFSGGWFKADAVKREQLMRKQALDASSRLARANDEREQISAYMQRYQHYLRIKAIRQSVAGKSDDNPEQGERLEWIERIVEAREARALPRINYAIAARKVHESLPPPAQGLTFYSNRMKLELGLIHEGDFIDYLQRLSKSPPGIFQIDRCSLTAKSTDSQRPPPSRGAVAGSKLLGSGGAAPADASNISVVCEIDWITLMEEARGGTSAGGGGK